MMDIVEQLQEMPELTPAQYWEAQASMWHENYKEAADEIERLREALREIYEVYAGSEGIPKPMTAAEGYLLELLMEAVRIAARALAGKIEEASDGHC